MSRFRRSILAVLLAAMVTLAPFGVRVGYGAAIRPVEGGRAGHLPVIGGPAPRHSRIEKQLRALHGSSGIAKGDFNGDGFGDLAIGIPDLDVNGKEDAGGVMIIYGSTRGLTATSRNVLFSQLFTEATPGLSFLARVSGAEAGDQFGTALASGDFDGDGRSDLAIGVPGKDSHRGLGTNKNSGAVYIIYATSTGLDPNFIPGDEDFHGLRFFDYGDFEEEHGGERLGSSLAWGNFDNGFSSNSAGDLAIGAPGAQVTSPCVHSPTFEDAGQVWLMGGTVVSGDHRGIFGPPDMLDETRVQECGQIESIDITGNHFGAALAAGNFDGDETTEDQIAIGVPDHAFAFHDIPHGGVVYVTHSIGFFGRPTTKITGYGGSVPLPAQGDRFGSVLAAGDIDGDGAADLAIGVPDRAVSAHANAGVVSIRYGTLRTAQSDGGLTGAVELWTQDRIFPNDPDNKSEKDDAFGAALAFGDFNGDGFADLAVGVPFEDIQLRNISGALVTIKNAGEVDVIYGSPSRLSNTFRAPQIWSKNTTGIGGSPADNELFGLTLTAWNFGKGRQADLAIGVPFEDLLVNRARVVDAGGVFVLYGSGQSTGDNGLTATGNQHWTPESAGLPGGAQPNEHFGRALY